MREAIWHVIFKIKNSDGIVRDYCRDEPPLIMDMECEGMMRFANESETRKWADLMIEKHGLHSYVLEKW